MGGPQVTLFELVWRWLRGVPPAAERSVPVVPDPPAKAPAGAKYLALYTYLEHRYASNVVLTFEQMEALLGFALPASARAERDWWTTAHGDGHSDAWTSARRTATPNLPARTVAFERLP